MLGIWMFFLVVVSWVRVYVQCILICFVFGVGVCSICVMLLVMWLSVIGSEVVWQMVFCMNMVRLVVLVFMLISIMFSLCLLVVSIVMLEVSEDSIRLLICRLQCCMYLEMLVVVDCVYIIRCVCIFRCMLVMLIGLWMFFCELFRMYLCGMVCRIFWLVGIVMVLVVLSMWFRFFQVILLLWIGMMLGEFLYCMWLFEIEVYIEWILQFVISLVFLIVCWID